MVRLSHLASSVVSPEPSRLTGRGAARLLNAHGARCDQRRGAPPSLGGAHRCPGALTQKSWPSTRQAHAELRSCAQQHLCLTQRHHGVTNLAKSKSLSPGAAAACSLGLAIPCSRIGTGC
jgi:hypothetical protein